MNRTYFVLYGAAAFGWEPKESWIRDDAISVFLSLLAARLSCHVANFGYPPEPFGELVGGFRASYMGLTTNYGHTGVDRRWPLTELSYVPCIHEDFVEGHVWHRIL